MNRKNERGIAMLVALFALLLLSVVGLGMMYSTNMETAINSNYRDKQTSMYAALAGLQEARDRLRPFDITLPMPTGRLVAPTALPILTAANVVYIINPGSGETVAPWSGSNTYRDTELCQENMLGLSGTPGVPCGTTDLPSVSTWYSVVDDSTATHFWHNSNPLDFKWARITLKKNNNTPVVPNGDATVTRQVCFDGERQLVVPVGYGPECNHIGSLLYLTVTAAGTGYTGPPNVTIDPPPSGGITALVHAIMTLTSATVGSVPVDSQGTGYVAAPGVTIDPPASGTQARAHVCLTSAECGSNAFIPPGSNIASVSIAAGAGGTQCYTTAPAVLFSGGGGTGAAATAALSTAATTCIAGFTVTGSCTAHRDETITGIGLTGSGSLFSGTFKFDHSGNMVAGYPTIQNAGSGWTANPTGITGMTGCGSLTLGFTRGYHINAPQTITPTSGGGGYTSPGPSVSFATGVGTTGTPATGTAVLGPEPATARKVLQIIVDDGGSGYTAVPGVTIGASTAGTTAMAHAVLATAVYKVQSITVDNPGAGYTTDPLVTITPTDGMGGGAQATTTLGRGAAYGKIYLVTALAQTKSGARSMVQLEATTALSGFFSTGALTIDGPNPTMQSMAHSKNFTVDGRDADTCSQGSEMVKPAVGGYDDPNADPATHSITDIVASLPDDRYGNYIGEGGTPTVPSVKNVYDSLGDTMGTPLGLKSIMDAVNSMKTNTPGTVNFGTPTVPAINYIDDNLNLSGNTDGYGILLVTGTLTISGNFTWYGPVLVIGDGVLRFSGGGNGVIKGTVLVAKIYPDHGHHADSDILPALGSPSIDLNGGGTNSILYDHCWATNMMSKIPINSPISLKPLKVLSFKTLPY